MIEREADHSGLAMNYARFLILPLWILATLALGSLMAEASSVFLWIVSAFFLFALLDPVAEYLKAHRWHTSWTAVFVVLLATVLVVGVITLFAHLSSGMVDELETSKRIFHHYYDSLENTWRTWTLKPTANAPEGISGSLAKPLPKVEVVQSSPFGGEIGSTLARGLGSAVTVLTFALLVPILAFFFLAERDVLARVFARAYPQPNQIWHRIVSATRAYFLGNLVLALVTYPLFLILFWFFSVPSSLTFAGFATFFNLIPFLGALLSGFLPALALVGQSDHLGAGLALYGCCAMIHFTVANFVTPKVLGSRVDINATTSTIALVAWGELWGGVGLLLAIPLTATLKILFESSNYFWLQWIAALMSENVDRALRPDPAAKQTATAGK